MPKPSPTQAPYGAPRYVSAATTAIKFAGANRGSDVQFHCSFCTQEGGKHLAPLVDAYASAVLGAGGWLDRLPLELAEYLLSMRNKPRTWSMCSLLRSYRNLEHHYNSCSRSLRSMMPLPEDVLR